MRYHKSLKKREIIKILHFRYEKHLNKVAEKKGDESWFRITFNATLVNHQTKEKSQNHKF